VADTLPSYTALVLAGGQGSRMQGQDKGLVLAGGQRLIDHALARLQAQTLAPQTVLISANRNASTYASLGWPVLPDTLPDYPGPLAGFLTGMQHCTTPWLLSVPCDSPQFPQDLAERLLVQALHDSADIVIAADRDSQGGQRKQAVFCLMRPTLAEDLSAFVLSGQGKIGAWVVRHRYSVVCFDQPGDDPMAFFNVNSAQELDQLISR
jgi:molybdopterin-guanine dinucleotide biosynthesis protein A